MQDFLLSSSEENIPEGNDYALLFHRIVCLLGRADTNCAQLSVLGENTVPLRPQCLMGLSDRSTPPALTLNTRMNGLRLNTALNRNCMVSTPVSPKCWIKMIV